jgi:diguanylate cyclase (GGDEF)-like protein
VLAGLVAMAPIISVAFVVFTQVEQAFRERAETALQASARTYGQRIAERVSSASEFLDQLAASDTGAHDSFTLLQRYAVFGESGGRVSGELRVPSSVLQTSVSNAAGALVVDVSNGYPELYLLRRSRDRLAIGLLSSQHLWRNAENPDDVAFCAVAAGVDAPLYCAGVLPDDVLAFLKTEARESGRLNWKTDAAVYLAAYSEPLASPGIQRPPIRIVASMPRERALAALESFRSLYLPTLCASIALALLGALLYARRVLHPLAKMLNFTKQLADRDVWGRADLRRQEHFTNLADDLQHMADDLAQQFNARETLSEIDHVILSGADMTLVVDLILRHIVESVQCRRAMVTILGDETETTAVTATMSRGHPVSRKGEVKVGEEHRDWLEGLGEGVLLSNPPKDAPSDPFVAVDTPHTFVLPVRADRKPAAAVSIMTMDGLGLDEIQKGHVRDLAGRLAVALESVLRSEELRRKAYFDDLTGLPNRDFCFSRLELAIKQAKHLRTGVAVMFIDLDGFKGINDSLGHIAGDELIRQAAYRLANCVGEAGTIGRLGGDEFAVVLPFPVKSADPNVLSKRVLEVIREPFMIGTSEIHLSASVGVARYPEDGDTRVELLRKADTAMYRAKESGRGRSVDYSNTMGIMVDERLRLEVDLRRALENEEFQIYYQPQMDMRTGRIVSAEALVRWIHPKRGFILPNEFVPVAEDTGYIAMIGSWVMSNACRQLARWQDQGLGLQRVSVNVSAGQFRRSDFLDVVESCLLELHFGRDMLELELTETVFVDDLKQAQTIIERLKASGVYVSIDDFGTGYSSLGYLKHLTFDAVKVDQSFIHELPGDRKSEAIVRAVLAMCHTLGKQVVAEGVETNRQLRYLRAAGVDIGQGFRIGKPMVADAFARYLVSMRRSLEGLEPKRA